MEKITSNENNIDSGFNLLVFSKRGNAPDRSIKGEEIQKMLEKINDVKKLNIHVGTKGEIILVLLGHKPSTEISISRNTDLPETVLAVLKKVGLLCERREFLPEQHSVPVNRRIICEIMVARDKITMDKLRKVDGRGKNHEEYGRLMGFPETAIQAFRTGRSDIIGSDKFRPNSLFGFMLSKDNAEEECTTLDTWDRVIHTYAPELYNEAKEQRKRLNREALEEEFPLEKTG